MSTSVPMPALGESVSEGTVTRWLKQVGDTVEVDEPLLEVSTDKVDTEIPSPVAGVLQRIVVDEDETVEVGAELAVIGDSGEGGDAPSDEGADDSADADADAGSADDETARSEPEPDPEPAPAPAAEQAGASPAAAEQSAESGGGASGDSDGDQSGGGTSVTMPALGESVSEGTVTRWLKQVGDTVEVDEPLVEVSTDKVDTEIPSPVGGTLLSISADEDATVEVGGELAVIGAAGGSAQSQQSDAAQSAPEKSEPAPEPAATEPIDSAPAAEAPVEQRTAEPDEAAQRTDAAPQPGYAAPSTPATPVQSGQAEPSAPADAPATNGQGTYVTPLVRKLATEQGIDLSAVKGTGVGGRIRKQDILEAAEAKRAAEKEAAAAKSAPAAAAPQKKPAAGPSPLRGRTEKLSRLRQTVAKRMVESLQVAAQLTTVVEIDVSKVARLRQQAKEQFLATHGVKLSFLPFFALATVEALREHPVVNSQLDMEANTVTYPDGEHLGIAVDTERGLMVPVIKEAGDLNLGGMARKIADLAGRTRANKVAPDELFGGTFTLTNTGSRGALFDTPIINQPQSAILGTGAVVKRAVVVDDPELGELIIPRSMVYFALSYDHRIVDGADAARFLVAVKERLQTGAFEADLGLA